MSSEKEIATKQEKKTTIIEKTTTVKTITEKSIEKRKEPSVYSNGETIFVGEDQYQLVKEYKEAFDIEKFGERYSAILSRYDFIVGDWGHEQLRLRGFFKSTNNRSNPDQRINALEDYLYEYCNFGCAYFVLEQVGERKEKQPTRKKRKRRPKKVYSEKQENLTKNRKPVLKARNEQKEASKKTMNKQKSDEKEARTFTIRQREE
ncbi:YutD family protein [Melissococcus plutonius]|uniref:Transcriptional regulator n=1 Tax=Melissococcus plutonius (strain ATCC 35311 / DSM 29964 / CIP 104052 / LMG 20360 / NCIMB 702443) TaxID=940190 RepID=F3YAV8_MELPT|nr:YutD family protein [Melissococcus plutonius]KMT32427.1 hypothetical protein MEPL6_3c04280 [Melissococcus plutonius]KMT33946.1 hypothetical protein MEPL8_5c00030 [Melissococcus plutonius]KMT39933.1 hypothetical protein MEPL12_3c00840 [Melissococcus plutonius]MBB5178444.1 uncharacterized protein YutD [Melissococcus plutonius]BAK21636.1 conserved hypothetical protein [Melissococcus plutonius ATCC 35311]